MDSARSDEGDDFSDARDDFSSLGCESEPGSARSRNSRCSFDEIDFVAKSLNYDFWAKEPISIDERRHEFCRRTGLVLERRGSAREEVVDVVNENVENVINKVTKQAEEIDTEASASTTPEHGKCVSNAGELCVSNAGELANVDDLVHRRTTSDGGILSESCNIASSSSPCHAEEYRVHGISNWVQHHFRRSRELVDNDNLDHLRNKERKEGWLKRLSFKGSSSFKGKNEGLDPLGSSSVGTENPGVHVSPHKKQWKELSSLYLGQDFKAHTGSIMAMKFSPDGKHLATGGQDGALRIWEVVQDERSANLDALGFDHSCVYVSANGVASVDSFNKRDDGVMRKLKKLPERACIISPKHFFRISEKPLHEFHDHEGAVLDISWSEKGSLLSSSVDKTVRLWQPGQNHCIRVFTHHNFVTCVQFNPVDNNYFISGSIDGKVRIWSILCWQVVHWIDIKEIVTAICYRPDGKGAIAGTILGKCHFYDITANRLHLDDVVCLETKKSASRKINSFQFSPRDSSRVIVTSGDSQLRILSGLGVVCKLRGPHNGKMNMSASFTVDGKYVVSASAESNVYIWDCSSADGTNFCYRTNDLRSCESFISENALIAIPWHGYKDASNQLMRQFSVKELESLSSRLSAVVLPSVGEVHTKQYKDVCQKMVHSDMWGLVIVTAGSDGRIRAYHNYSLPVRT